MAIKARPINDALMREILHWVDIDLWRGVIRWKRHRGPCRVGDEAGCVNLSNGGYRQIRFDRKAYMVHRVLVAYREWLCNRELSEDKEIDHIDGNPLNNCIDNLRIVPHSMNTRNAKMRRDNTSGVNGVSWHKAKGKWQAYCRIRGKMRHLGLFDCIDEAAKVAKAFRDENRFTDRHGEPA